MKTVKNDFEIRLNSDWRITCDELQFMVQKKASSKGKEVWIGHSFITERDHLFTTFRRREIVLDEGVEEKIKALPEKFSDFWKTVISSPKTKKAKVAEE